MTPISSPAAKSAAGIGSTEMLQIFISNSEGHALTGSSGIVEDCAHAHGAKWRKKGVESLGDAGSFSMQTSKLLTAGEGGVVTAQDDEVFERCQSYVNCGRAVQTDRFQHRIIGFNYRMT